MPISYTNRKDEVHYLRAVKTKKGKFRYYIVKNRDKYTDEELLSSVPEGFEFYEFPFDARVVLRKKLVSSVNKKEKTIIQQVMSTHETVNDYMIDLEKTAAIIYIAGLSRDEFFYGDEDHFKLIQRYDAKLRIEKEGESEYAMQRFCHLSRYYGWITMETSNDLKYLAEKYCYHIDKESLLDFWIEGEENNWQPEMIIFNIGKSS